MRQYCRGRCDSRRDSFGSTLPWRASAPRMRPFVPEWASRNERRLRTDYASLGGRANRPREFDRDRFGKHGRRTRHDGSALIDGARQTSCTDGPRRRHLRRSPLAGDPGRHSPASRLPRCATQGVRQDTRRRPALASGCNIAERRARRASGILATLTLAATGILAKTRFFPET